MKNNKTGTAKIGIAIAILIIVAVPMMGGVGKTALACNHLQYIDKYNQYYSTIKSAIVKYNLQYTEMNPYALVAAVIEQESSWKPNANGDGGNSLGIMQINLKKHPECELNNNDVYDASKNIDCGVKFLSSIASSNSYDKNKLYKCKQKTYTGVQAILRYYNGWFSECGKGDENYAEDTPQGTAYPKYKAWADCLNADGSLKTLANGVAKAAPAAAQAAEASTQSEVKTLISPDAPQTLNIPEFSCSEGSNCQPNGCTNVQVSTGTCKYFTDVKKGYVNSGACCKPNDGSAATQPTPIAIAATSTITCITSEGKSGTCRGTCQSGENPSTGSCPSQINCCVLETAAAGSGKKEGFRDKLWGSEDKPATISDVAKGSRVLNRGNDKEYIVQGVDKANGIIYAKSGSSDDIITMSANDVNLLPSKEEEERTAAKWQQGISYAAGALSMASAYAKQSMNAEIAAAAANCHSICKYDYDLGQQACSAGPTCNRGGCAIKSTDCQYQCNPGSCGGWESREIVLMVFNSEGEFVLEDTVITDAKGEFKYTFTAPSYDDTFSVKVSVPGFKKDVIDVLDDKSTTDKSKNKGTGTDAYYKPGAAETTKIPGR